MLKMNEHLHIPITDLLNKYHIKYTLEPMIADSKESINIFTTSVNHKAIGVKTIKIYLDPEPFYKINGHMIVTTFENLSYLLIKIFDGK